MTAWRCLLAVCFMLLCGAAGTRGQTSGAAANPSDLDLEQLGKLKIQSASLHDQTLGDAPARMTVITAEEIRKFGYWTLAEALAYVPDFYFVNDHTYTYLGTRGFSLPGDYASRLIVMIDGHDIDDNIFNSSGLFGNDFPLAMDLVDRIEVLRGSSSALYGSSGMLATINVITKKPANVKGTTVRLETGSLGERKAQACTVVTLPRDAKLLLSSSLFNNSGASVLYFPEFDAPQTNYGRAIDADGEKGYQLFANLAFGHWEILALAGDRVKVQPTSWGDTVFNDRGTRAEDSRGFLEASYTKDLPGDRRLSWQVSYDAYRYRGIYHYQMAEGVEDTRERDYGDWLGSKFTYRLKDGPRRHLTVGADLRLDLRTLQNAFDVQPQPLERFRIDERDRYAGLFAQQEWEFGQHWAINMGARFDWSRLRPHDVSPRLAAIYRPDQRTDFKILYSHGFRNPSSYEMFFNDDGLTQLANPSLRPETMESFEIDFDRDITSRIRLGLTGYRYLVHHLIEQTYTPDGLLIYLNEHRVHATGASLELHYRTTLGIDIAGSLQVQRAAYGAGLLLPNSPSQIGKFRVSIPLWHNIVTVGGGLQALGRRDTYAGQTLPSVILPEVVLSTAPSSRGWQLSAGVRNLANSFYRDPAGLSPAVDTIAGTGRTYYLTLSWSSPAEDAKDEGTNPPPTRR